MTSPEDRAAQEPAKHCGTCVCHVMALDDPIDYTTYLADEEPSEALEATACPVHGRETFVTGTCTYPGCTQELTSEALEAEPRCPNCGEIEPDPFAFHYLQRQHRWKCLPPKPFPAAPSPDGQPGGAL